MSGKVDRFEKAVRRQTVCECILATLDDKHIPPDTSAKQEEILARVVLSIVNDLRRIEEKYE